jgi:hypothetical protein
MQDPNAFQTSAQFPGSNLQTQANAFQTSTQTSGSNQAHQVPWPFSMQAQANALQTATQTSANVHGARAPTTHSLNGMHTNVQHNGLVAAQQKKAGDQTQDFAGNFRRKLAGLSKERAGKMAAVLHGRGGTVEEQLCNAAVQLGAKLSR